MVDARQTLERDGFVLLRDVVPDSILDEVGAVLRSLRARGAARSRQVLYTHSPPPGDRPRLDALMDQWLSPHRLGPPNTRASAEAIRALVAPL